jgi:hypothetical protein
MKPKTNRRSLQSTTIFLAVVRLRIRPKTSIAAKAALLPRAVSTPIVMRPKQRISRHRSFIEILALSAVFFGIVSSPSFAQDPACCGSWTQRSPLTSPSARQHHVMAYDSVRHVVVLFGGEGPLGDTWEWDGNSWTQIAVNGPSARDESAMVFDSARGVVVLFGGGDHNSPQASGETWEYPVGGTWVRRANSAGIGATTGPSPRVRHAMVYDSIRGKTVLFGGLDASGPGGSFVAQADTWEWDGAAWALRATTGPAARTSHAMAFDIARSQTVLFGGFGAVVYGDTWEWDGTAWTQKATTGPSARYDHAMAYAGGCPRTMLFAGYDSSGRVSDNWEWSGTVWTPLTTGPSARNGHKMAYDSFRRRFVLFGGYSLPAGQNAETWEFITARPFTFRGGRKDNFALPNDPTVRSTRLNNALPGITWKDFDDTTSNRYIGHTFSNLPANIVRAQLIIRLKPHSDIPFNDSLHLGLLSGPPATWAWQSNIRNLPGAGGDWTANPATTFILDLGNLPTGVDILAKLATDRYLDLIVQDDSAIDWVDLCVWTCPRRPIFFGLPHSPLGQALLQTGANGEVIISNIGSSGNDGARIDLGEAEGWGFTIDTIDYGSPVGAFKQWTMRGTIDGLPDQEAWTERHELIPDGATKALKVSLDAGGLGATTNELQLFDGGSLLYTSLTPSGELYSFVANGSTNPPPMFLVAQWDATCVVLHPADPWPLRPRGTALQIHPWNKIVSYAEDPTRSFTYRTAIESRAANVGTSVLHDEALVVLGKKAVRARGGALLEASNGHLTVTNLGSSGQDGVEISLGKVDTFDVGLDPIVDPEGNPLQFTGAYLEATAIGSVNGVPDETLGVLRITQAGIGAYDIFANFAAIGSSTQHVQVFNQGALVADFPGHSGPVGTASAWMSRIGKLGGQTECFVAHWPESTSFLISGPSGTYYVGDELRILAEGATQIINHKSDLQLLTAGIPEITLGDVQAVPQRVATLANISTRLRVETGDRVMIGGFIIQGSAPKKVIIRAIGPSLAQFGIPNPLADPVLELRGPAGFTTITNDNWRDTQQAEITATGLRPTDDLESAIVAMLAPGAYTGVVRGKNNISGVGSVEVYDISATSGSFLANISTRGVVQTGDEIMIGGFIVVTQPTRLIVRAIGPSLTPFGVPQALANPTLELRDSNGALLLANNDWQDNPAQAAELTAAGLAPTNPLESGLAVTLPPGFYTALVAGLNNTTGIGLVEVYDRGP